MGFYEITQNNLKKELLLLHEVQNELTKLPEGTLQRKDKRGRVEYYTRKKRYPGIHTQKSASSGQRS